MTQESASWTLEPELANATPPRAVEPRFWIVTALLRGSFLWLFLFAVAFIFLATELRQLQIEEAGLPAQAIVISKWSTGGTRSHHYHLELRYTAQDGRKVHVRSTLVSQSQYDSTDAGRTVQVKYLPDTYETVEDEGTGLTRAWCLLAGLLALAPLLPVLNVVRLNLREKGILERGSAVMGTVRGVSDDIFRMGTSVRLSYVTEGTPREGVALAGISAKPLLRVGSPMTVIVEPDRPGRVVLYSLSPFRARA
jgi:hypothetical protein